MKSKEERQKDFINKSKTIHHNYDYKNVKYDTAKTKVEIICKDHGSFYQRPNDHLNGHGCPKCGNEQKRIKQQIDFFQLSIEKYDDLYDYSESVYINNRIPIKIKCNKHNEYFTQTSYAHLKGYVSCKLCRIKSKGEEKVKSFLESFKVKYIREYRFNDCVSKYRLPFDFYCPYLNLCIEYDGRQHYDKTSLFYSDELVENDNLKNEYCKKNNIKLIRIRHDEDIEEKLKILNDSK